jgi:hypothetical protein
MATSFGVMFKNLRGQLRKTAKALEGFELGSYQLRRMPLRSLTYREEQNLENQVKLLTMSSSR